MNSVILIGNLTKDPELRYSGENPICRFTLAVNDRRRGPNGDWVDDPSFIPIVVFGKQAENCDKFLEKGRKCAVNGKIKTGSYEKQDGTKVYTTDVIANNVEFLNANGAGQNSWPPQNGYQKQEKYVSRKQYEEEKQQGMFPDPYNEPPNGFQKIKDDDIPF